MRDWAYYASKGILWAFFRLRFGLEVEGQAHVPKRGPFIIASNHLSFLDPPVIGVACPRPLVFMARADLFEPPLLGAYLRAVHVMPLQRGESDPRAVRQAITLLKAGRSIGMFPEGGRQLSGQVGEAKRGIGLLAHSSQAPVIPTLVTGTFQALPPQARGLHPAKIRVVFGPRISYTDASEYSPGASTVPGRSRDRHQQVADAVTHEWRRLAQRVTATKI